MIFLGKMFTLNFSEGQKGGILCRQLASFNNFKSFSKILRRQARAKLESENLCFPKSLFAYYVVR